jgi:hypothetical protein
MKKINLTVLIALVVLGLSCISSKAMSPNDSTDNDYLKTHGYSPEMIRLVNLQKDRVEQKTVAPRKKYNKSNLEQITEINETNI